MMQILFFLSLICITAMLLRLFWYLDDSHEEEIRLNLMRYRHVILHPQQSSSLDLSDPSYKFTGHVRANTISDYRHFARKKSSAHRQIKFYDVGTASNTDNISSSAKHIECA